MSLLNLRDSCRLYERQARKVRGVPMSMEQFNKQHRASLPTSSKAIRVHKRYLKQLARAKKQHGVPLNAAVPSLYKALQSESEAELKPTSFSNVAQNIATRREPVAVSPRPVGAVPKVEKSISKRESASLYTEAKREFAPPAAKAPTASIAEAALAEIKPAKRDAISEYKRKLKAWMDANPGSKLHKTTQIIHFVDNRAETFSPLDTSAKFTRNSENLLGLGRGEFKMRSGIKKVYDILPEDGERVKADRQSKVKGPYFVRVI